MRSHAEYEEDMRHVAAGFNPSHIARLTGIPRGTIREWASGKAPRHQAGEAVASGIACPGSCDSIARRAESFPDIYAHLLGLYLGDGTISRGRRGVEHLRIFLDLKYPAIIDGAANAMIVIRGSERIGLTPQPGCLQVGSTWKHWHCVFPQAGPGMKHERSVALVPWQQPIVDRHPYEFLRGLYESDGSRHLNPVRRRVAGEIKTYRYSRYMFSNESDDIRRMFTDACDALGVHWTRANRKNIAVSRRADVAFLDGFLGPKQ